MYVRKNALQVLIPKYGLEGTIYLTPVGNKKQEVTFEYDEMVSCFFLSTQNKRKLVIIIRM